MLLVEVVVAAAILLVGVLTLTATLDASLAAVPEDEAVRAAAGAAAAALEQLRALGPDEVCARAPWAAFAVPALSGGGGAIFVHTNELEVDAALGLPRDLDGDGAVTNPDVSAAAALLPVEVVVTWQGRAGTRTLRLATLMARRDRT